MAMAMVSGAGALAGCDSNLAMSGMAARSPMAAGYAAHEMPAPGQPAMNTEQYARIVDNPFLDATRNPLSTFGVDVDTASYSNVRRFLQAEHRLPPKDAVRIEEMVNYFPYAYPQPAGDAPFSVTTDASPCPWEPHHRLVRVGLHGRTIDEAQMPAKNLVFLIDVSGSMDEENKLPLVKSALKLLVQQMRPQDRIAIVVYAGNEGLALASTPGSQKDTILGTIDHLDAGGSTNGGAGIQLAYKIARDNFIQGGINRVLLSTDGDFNVGVTSEGDLERLIEDEKKSGVFLTVLGVGTGNVKDATMEGLADKGNGNYAYLDTLEEARKVLVTESASTLVTIAKDVKVQVEWNPARVSAYRLLGYENRVMRAEDFKDDAKDGGEIGAGHTVTALYEIVPPGEPAPTGSVDPLRYQSPPTATGANSPELMTVKLRYKQPDGDASREIDQPLVDAAADASTDMRFASAVVAFGMLLRGSEYKEGATYAMVKDLAAGARGDDPGGYRAEMVRMVDAAAQLAAADAPVAH
jgi:Ca-activated chloride channel family protein